MNKIAAHLHAASPQKATLGEAMRDHGLADDATPAPRHPVRPLIVAHNLGEKSDTCGASAFSVGAFLFALPNPAPIDADRGQRPRRGQRIRQRQRTADPLRRPAVTSRRIASIISLCSSRLSFLVLQRLAAACRCLHFVPSARAVQTTANLCHNSSGTSMENAP